MLPTFSPARHAHSGRTRQMLAAVTICLGLVPLAGAAAILSSAGTAGAVAAPCQPRITHVSKFPPGKAPNVTVTGTCFGTAEPSTVTATTSASPT